MKKKTLKSNVIFNLGLFIFIIGFIFCLIFRFRFMIFNIIMFFGIIIETYGLFFIGKKINKKKKKSKKAKEVEEVL